MLVVPSVSDIKVWHWLQETKGLKTPVKEIHIFDGDAEFLGGDLTHRGVHALTALAFAAQD